MGTGASKKKYTMIYQSNYCDTTIFDQSLRYHTLEATIKNITLDSTRKNYNIQCDPSASDLFDIRLEKSNPNFTSLYNGIVIGNTYKFTIYYVADLVIPLKKCRPILTGVGACTISQITGKVISYVTLNGVINDLKNYDVYTIDTNNLGIRLIQKKSLSKKSMIGQTYKITYSKIYGGNFYEIKSMV